jgi:hypothetical protein
MNRLKRPVTTKPAGNKPSGAITTAGRRQAKTDALQDRIMNMDASYEQQPFSYAELAAGGIAMAAVALVAFLAFQRISGPLALTASASPSSSATRLPETAPPTRPGDLSPAPDPASPAWPKVAPAAAPAAMVKPWGAATSDQLGPLDMFQIRNFAAHSAKPGEEVATSQGASRSLKPEEEVARAVRDTSNPSDALWIQTRLRDLGYYSASVTGVWGPASRRALLDFKIMNGLPDGDRWDRETEQAVSSRQSVGAHGTFIGVWAKGIEGCLIGRGALLVIRPSGAKTDGGKCDFHSVKREAATTWQVQADCSAALQQPDTGSDLSAWLKRAITYLSSNGAVATEERMQRANVSLKVTASRLHWTSEHDDEIYFRCPKS